MSKRLGVRSVVALLIFTLVVSAFGFVAAQDNSAKPFLGVGITSADNGVKVDQVESGSPAEKAGIKVDDVITAVDTKAVTFDTIGSVLSGHKVGDVITLSITRGSNKMDVKVTLAAHAEAPANTPSADRPVLGVRLENTDNGPTVRAVAAGSPAEKAGIKEGDVLTKIGDTAVTDAQSASAAVQTHKVGDEVAIEVTRDGKTVTVNATLAAGSTITVEPPSQTAPNAPTTSNRPMLGVSLEDTDNGPVVRTVVAGSPAEKAGIKEGDVLTKIGDTEVKDAQSTSAAVQTHKIGDEVAIEVTRDGKTVTVNVTLAAATMDMNPMPFNPGGVGITFNGNDKSWTISGLPEDSDLHKSGLREGDKITKFDGTAYDPAELMVFLSKAKESNVTLTVTRDGKDQEIKVSAPALMTFGFGGFGGMGFGDEPFLNMPFNAGGSRLGVQFVMLDPSVAKEHNVTETVGALVTEVMPQSPAEKAGLKVNDVVTAVNGDVVNGEHNLRDLLAAHKPGDSIKLDVMRDGKKTQIDVTLDQMPAGELFQFPGQGGENGFPFQMPTPEPSSPLTNGSSM